MKRIKFISILALLLAIAQGAWAQETLTVYDGTESHSYAPAYIQAFNNYTRSQYIIPAANLEAMNGNIITALKYYSSTSNKTSTCNVDVYLKEVSYTTFEETPTFETKSGIVYTGTLSIAGDGTLTITFTTPYTYNGGNLLIGMENTETGNYITSKFYGQDVAGAVAFGNSSTSLAAVTANREDFIPKTTFTYEDGTYPKPKDLTATLTPGNGTIADLSWTQANGSPEGWVVEYSTSSDFTGAPTKNVSGTASTQLTGLTAETTYYARVKADYGGGNYSNWSNTVSFTPTNAYTLTVYENATGSNLYFPVNGTAANFYQKNEFVIPAGQLSAMGGGTITEMTFYLSTPASSAWTGTFQVFMKEVDYTTISAYSGTEGATTVYTGTLDATGSTMTIEFTDEYTYEGGNLLVGIYGIGKGNSVDARFVGETATGACINGSDASSLDNVSTIQRDFIPKTKFAYTPSGGTIYYKPADLTVTPTPGNGTIADLSWTQAKGNPEGWVVEYATSSDFTGAETMNVNTTSAHLTGLIAETPYYARVKADYGGGSYSKWSSTISFTLSEKLRIGSEEGTQTNLPFNNYYGYALSQQIYTVEELGTAGLIQSIDFYKPNTIECNRTLDIYMVSTAKSSFSSPSDWIAVTAADLVFSGTVSFANNDWTTITLSEPFFYDGQQNVAIMIDDNTNGCKTNTTFYAFTPTTTNQALYVRSDGTNYDPTNPSSGTLTNSKNQIRILKEAMGDCMKPTGLAATEVAPDFITLSWNENGSSNAWKVAYKTGDADFTEVNATAIPFTLSGLAAETEYTVKVRPACDEKWSKTVTFTTLANDAVPYELSTTDIYANAVTLNWSGVQNSYNVRYRTPSPSIIEGFEDNAEFTANWTVISNNTANNVSSGKLGRNGDATRNGSYGFRFSSYSKADDYNQYLISPELSGATSVEFWYKSSNSSTETFRVGYSTTGNNVADFNNNWGNEIKSTSSSDWTKFELNLPDGVKYVAINYYSDYKYYLYIDDMTIDCGSAGEWVNRTNVTSPIDIDGLEQETKYEWQVQGIYNNEPTEWSTMASFTTTDEFKPGTAVDLGLPSGKKWADRNVGAGSETGYGTYYAWSSSDIATAQWGVNWRMPTLSEAQELINNTDQEWATIGGVNGTKFMKKTDHSVYIFVPAAGWDGSGNGNIGTAGAYWTSTAQTESRAYEFAIRASGNATGNDNMTHQFTIRPVQMFAGEGTEASPYLIASTTDWNNLVSAVNAGETYSGNYFKMTANVGTVSTWMTGTFSGTFDGDGKTLTVGYSNTTADVMCAPFGTLNGATIQNLKVAGSISSNQKLVAGIAAQCSSTGNNVTNCLVSATINSSYSGNAADGGLVAVVDNGASLNVTGCAFAGKLLTTNGTTSCGGIVGWNRPTGTCTLTNCLYAPASTTGSEVWMTSGASEQGNANFCRYSLGGSAPTLTNCYYTTDFSSGSGSYTAQGLQAHSISAGDYVSTLAISGDATATHDVSGITVYSTGISFNDGSTTTFYGGSDQTVSLALTAETRTGYQFKQYAASQGTLSGQTTDTPTLTMPGANSTANDAVTISAEYDPTYNADFADGNDNDGWTIIPMQQIEGGTVTVSYTGENKVKSVTVTNKYAIAHSLAASVVGDIVGTDGLAYSVAEKDKLPVGVSAAGVVTYKSGETGIVVALQNCASTYTWSDASAGAAAYTPAVSGQTWKLGTKDEMSNAIVNDYATKYGYITAAGGTFPYPNNYWSATEVEGYTTERAWRIWVESNGVPTWHDYNGVTKADECQVRPIIAF